LVTVTLVALDVVTDTVVPDCASVTVNDGPFIEAIVPDVLGRPPKFPAEVPPDVGDAAGLAAAPDFPVNARAPKKPPNTMAITNVATAQPIHAGRVGLFGSPDESDASAPDPGRSEA
jgi:hypothetical protein